jgi:hypothetical protein
MQGEAQQNVREIKGVNTYPAGTARISKLGKDLWRHNYKSRFPRGERKYREAQLRAERSHINEGAHAFKPGLDYHQPNHYWYAGTENPEVGLGGLRHHKYASLIQRRVKTEEELTEERYRKKAEAAKRFKKREKERKKIKFGGVNPDDPFAQLQEAVEKDYDKLGYDKPEDPEQAGSDDDESSEDEDEEELKLLSDGKTLRYVDLFNPRQKGAGQMFVFVGKSERGKTHMLRYLLYHGCSRVNDPFQFGLIFVRTKFKSAYKFHKLARPYVRVYEGFLLETLKAYVRNLEQRYKKYGKLEPSFLVFDDLVGVLNNDNSWFQNFIGTYRHYNITIFIAVQYLTGRNSISPIMREQTTAALMWNSKTHLTNDNLFKNYGQLFPDLKSFTKHFYNMTDQKFRGTRHACMVYFEWQDEIHKNYMSWLAPAKLPDGQVIVKGPDQIEGKDFDERHLFLGKELQLVNSPFIKEKSLKSNLLLYNSFKKLYQQYQQRVKYRNSLLTDPGPVPFNKADVEHIVRRLREIHKKNIPKHLKDNNHLDVPSVTYFGGDYYIDWKARIPTSSDDAKHALGARTGAHRVPVWMDGREDPNSKVPMNFFRNFRQGNQQRAIPTLDYQLPLGVPNFSMFNR